MPNPLIRIKRLFFSWIRERLLFQKAANILNYLDNTEVIEGAIPRGKNVLILAPHPDDESIGCGGIMPLMVRAGCQVDIAFITDGANSDEPSSPPSSYAGNAVVRRMEDLEMACAGLGIRTTFFLGATDGELHLALETAQAFRALVEKRHYDVVFSPWPYDSHSDHAKTFRILATVLKETGIRPEVWLYEVWNPLPANRVVAIDEVMDQKLGAIRCYKNEVEKKGYDEVALGLARYRSLLCKNAKYAEAFLVANTAFILSLATKTETVLERVQRPLAPRLSHVPRRGSI